MTEESAVDSQRAADGTITVGAVSTNRILRAFSVQLFARIVGMVASFMTIAVTTRYLGPTDYGHLTSAIAFVALWTSLTELGIGATIVRRVTSGRGDLTRLVRVNQAMSLIYALPVTALAAISGALIYRDTDSVHLVAIVSGSLFLTALTTFSKPVFDATVRFTAVAVADVVARIGSLVVTVLLAHAEAGLVWFAAVQLVPPALTLIIQGFAALRIVRGGPIFDLGEAWDLLRESLPQTGVLIIGVLYWRIDAVILSVRSTAEQVGVYGLAYSLAFVPTVIASFFLSSTLSSMTDLFAKNRIVFSHFVRRGVETMVFVGAPLGLVGVILADPIVRLISSEEFVPDGGPTLSLLFVAAAVTFLNGVLSQALFAAYDQVFLLRLNICNLIANIVLNWLLVPHFGAVGAGMALLVSEVSGLLIVSWRLSSKSAYRTPFGFVLRLVIPLLAAAGTAILLHGTHVAIALLGSAVAYVAVNLGVGPMSFGRLKGLRSSDTEQGVTEEVRPRLTEVSTKDDQLPGAP